MSTVQRGCEKIEMGRYVNRHINPASDLTRPDEEQMDRMLTLPMLDRAIADRADKIVNGSESGE